MFTPVLARHPLISLPLGFSTKRVYPMKMIQLMICVIFSIAATTVYAYKCSNFASDADDAQRHLKRASQESNLNEAKDYMRKARNSLDDVVLDAKDCGCDSAASEFDSASTYSRRARDASDAQDFIYEYNRAVRAYNDGIDAINRCARPR